MCEWGSQEKRNSLDLRGNLTPGASSRWWRGQRSKEDKETQRSVSAEPSAVWEQGRERVGSSMRQSLAGAGGQQLLIRAPAVERAVVGGDASRPTERGRNKPGSASQLACLWQMEQEAADSGWQE